MVRNGSGVSSKQAGRYAVINRLLARLAEVAQPVDLARQPGTRMVQNAACKRPMDGSGAWSDQRQMRGT